MKELIRKLEQLTGPDVSIDMQIHHTLELGHGNGVYSEAPPYTASVDAALSLLREYDAEPQMFVRAALSVIGNKHALHVAPWPLELSFQGELARHITAEVLRAKATP